MTFSIGNIMMNEANTDADVHLNSVMNNILEKKITPN